MLKRQATATDATVKLGLELAEAFNPALDI